MAIPGETPCINAFGNEKLAITLKLKFLVKLIMSTNYNKITSVEDQLQIVYMIFKNAFKLFGTKIRLFRIKIW